MPAGISPALLGQRIRHLRITRNLTQQDLAGEDYSKSYISAIEQGKTRPSLEALQRLASRLQIPASTLLDPSATDLQPLEGANAPKRVRRRRGLSQATSLESDSAAVDVQLAAAAHSVYTGNPATALNLLRSLLPREGTRGENTPALDAAQRLSALYLLGLAAVHAGNTEEAVSSLQQGVQSAERLGNREAAERLRNLLGTAYFKAGQSLIALEHHGRCAQAADAGVITDPNLRFLVYANLAADYWSLQSRERALTAYRSAVELAEELGSLSRQAEAFWARATQTSPEWQSWRRRYPQPSQDAARALGVFEALDNMRELAMVECSYGKALLEDGSLDEAETHLKEGLRLAETLGLGLDEAQLLTYMAQLNVQRDNLDEAQRYVEQAIELSRRLAGERRDAKPGKNSSASPDARPPENALEVVSSALALGGEIATRRGDTEVADALFTEALDLIDSVSNARVAGDVYQRYAQSLSSRGRHEQASRYYERAYTARTRRG